MTGSILFLWSMSLVACVMLAPNASAWASRLLAQADPTLPSWLVNGGPTGVVGLMCFVILKTVLPRITKFVDHGIEILERVEEKLDRAEKRETDGDAQQVRDTLAVLRQREREEKAP